MVRYGVIIVAGILCVGAVSFCIRELILRFFGIATDAEVIAVKEPEKGSYVHTLRFVHNGKTVERDDKTGYSQPKTKGEICRIICSKSDAGRFEYAEQLRKNILVSGILIVMCILMILRFTLTVDLDL